MNETLEILATPGAVAVSLLWIHSRLSQVERGIEAIARHVEAQMPPRERKPALLPLLAVAVPLAVASCASIKQTAFEESIGPDGTYTTRRIDSRVSAVGDAQSLADRLTVTQERQSIGAEGANTSATTTNSPAVVDALTRLLEAAR